MRFAFLIFLLPASAFAALSYDYTATANSGFIIGQTTQTLTDTQYNQEARALNTGAPYFGGTGAGPGSTIDHFQVGAVFLARASQNDGFWGSADVIGTISVDRSGTLNIQYSPSPGIDTYLLSKPETLGLLVGKNNFSQILFNNPIGIGITSCSLPVNAGDQLNFHLWYSIGSVDQPIYNSSLWGATIDTSFTLTPEPATLILMLGAIVLCPKKCYNAKRKG